MHINLTNKTYETIIRYLHTKVCIQLVQALVKAQIVKNSCIYQCFIILGFLMELLASAIFYDMPSLAGVLVKDQLGCC